MRPRRPPTTATRPIDVRMPPIGVSGFVSRHGRRFRTAELVHPYHKLCVVEAGRGDLRHAGGAAPLEAGVLVRIPPHRPHRFEDAPDARLTLSGLCVTDGAVGTAEAMKAAWRDVADRLPPFAPASLPGLAAAEFQRMIRQIIRESTEDAPHAGLACLGVVAGFLVTLGRVLDARDAGPAPPADDGFAASLAWIEQRLTRRITIPELARVAGMSYRGYTARFHREFGMTVTQHLNRRRVAIARQRLLDTGDIVSSAMEAGFGDLSHFYRQFKAHAGCTPAAYLARAAGPHQARGRAGR